MSQPVIIGYYRYTDIWFEWHQAVPNPEDGKALKAVLAHDSIVHPDNPLHEEGIDGIRLFMGTLPNGHKRLLFSSKQVEYVRYWLHAMKITDTLLPLPYSECMLTEDSHLRVVSPIVFANGGELRQSVKEIDKANKRLKGLTADLSTRRDRFERIRTFWAEKAGRWLAIDFEDWDRDHTVITEFGWSLMRWKAGREIMETGHLIVEENKWCTNTYVASNRYDYQFGTSETIKKAAFKKRIQDLIATNSAQGPLYLIFHDYSQDLKCLKSKQIEAPLTGLSETLPDAVPDDGIFIVDTGDMFGALEGKENDRTNLRRMCNLLNISTTYLHNAGNDAHYTMLAMKEMASGDPVDVQRDKRWPSHDFDGQGPNSGVNIAFKPWEEDPDYSDTEGIMDSGPQAMDVEDD